MKRQRGRGRRPGGGGGHQHNNYNNPNRSMDSNGPDNTKVRGPAAVVYERYLQHARDAASSGDRVLSENYLQHADHYFRLVRAMQPAAPPPQPERYTNEEFEGQDEGAELEAAADDEQAPRSAPVAGGDQPEAEFLHEQEQRAQDRDGDPRRRRGRRNRYRPGGGEGEVNDEGGGEGEARREDGEPPRREAREGFRRERPPREDRRPREGDDDRASASPEGFSNGPKPAFLRD
ncbi:MAG: DUF4167 domain-containing protein [Hyphomonadaceae bacterium]|nr:DUF4167 domain-containing protein [Hyphomonadaceae bacterium]